MTLRGLNHAMGFPYDNMATLGQFIFTGILERFPQLRLAILGVERGLGAILARPYGCTHARSPQRDGKARALIHVAERVFQAAMYGCLRQ